MFQIQENWTFLSMNVKRTVQDKSWEKGQWPTNRQGRIFWQGIGIRR